MSDARRERVVIDPEVVEDEPPRARPPEKPQWVRDIETAAIAVFGCVTMLERFGDALDDVRAARRRARRGRR